MNCTKFLEGSDLAALDGIKRVNNYNDKYFSYNDDGLPLDVYLVSPKRSGKPDIRGRIRRYDIAKFRQKHISSISLAQQIIYQDLRAAQIDAIREAILMLSDTSLWQCLCIKHGLCRRTKDGSLEFLKIDGTTELSEKHFNKTYIRFDIALIFKNTIIEHDGTPYHNLSVFDEIRDEYCRIKIPGLKIIRIRDFSRKNRDSISELNQIISDIKKIPKNDFLIQRMNYLNTKGGNLGPSKS